MFNLNHHSGIGKHISLFIKKEYPLHIYISIVCIALIFACGLTIEASNYIDTSINLFNTARQNFRKSAYNTVSMLIDRKVTASETVRYLSRSDLAQARDFPTRMKSLPLMFESLLINPKLDTISCGYDTGDYFALRRMNRFLIEQYGIPRSSIYALLSHDTRNPASGGVLGCGLGS